MTKLLAAVALAAGIGAGGVLVATPMPAQATLIPAYMECVALPDATVGTRWCGIDASRQGAAFKAVVLFCKDAAPLTCSPLDYAAVNEFTSWVTIRTCGPNGVCANSRIVTQAAASVPPIDTCTVATGTSGPCGAAVALMNTVTKAQNDPTKVFHDAQTCIAQASCALRCTLENCDWLSTVVPDFIRPYMTKAHKWSEVEARCQAENIVPTYGPLWCGFNMARLHITTDLAPALAKSGCGSQADWDKVFGVIQQCSKTSLPSSTPLLGPEGAGLIAKYLRNNARQECIATRTAAGLPVDVNPSQKGFVCTP